MGWPMAWVGAEQVHPAAARFGRISSEPSRADFLIVADL